MLVDQGTHLWVWSENVVSTFALKVADKIWHDLKNNSRDSSNATVILKGFEPDVFKALFPTWIEDVSTENNV